MHLAQGFVSFKITVYNITHAYNIQAITESDDVALINVILSHNNFQRQKISNAYENMYGRVISNIIFVS